MARLDQPKGGQKPESDESRTQTWQHGLGLINLHLNELKDFWSSVLWSDETKLEMHSVTFRENQSQHISTKSSYQLLNKLMEGR